MNTRRCATTCAAESPTNGGSASKHGVIRYEALHRRLRPLAHGDTYGTADRRFERRRRGFADRHPAFAVRFAAQPDKPLRSARLEPANGRYRNRGDFTESRNQVSLARGTG